MVPGRKHDTGSGIRCFNLPSQLAAGAEYRHHWWTQVSMKLSLTVSFFAMRGPTSGYMPDHLEGILQGIFKGTT
jgi:hypothetical protein